MRTCFVCKEEQPLENFAESYSGVGGRRSSCVRCNAPTKRISQPRAAGQPRAQAPERKLPDLALEPGHALVLNTYAGSLLEGAKLAGVPVAASLEDCGFGQRWQLQNFPVLAGRTAATPAAWPEGDFSRGVVIAHPPCAAFSQAGKAAAMHGSGNFGLKSTHFEETRRVLDYALSRGAAWMAVESVQGAMEGARSAHDEIADRHGYNVFRLLQNACTFGVPQWRPRFWAVFSKAGKMAAWHDPKCVSLSDVLDGQDPGEPDARMAEAWQAQLRALEVAGFDLEKATGEPGKVAANIRRYYRQSSQVHLVAREFSVSTDGAVGDPVRIGHSWVASTPWIMDPDGCAPVLMADVFYIYRGRVMTPREYRAVMGFPRDYVLTGPEARTDKTQPFRLWLSKGVVPQVAAWVLELMTRNQSGDVPDGAQWLAPGDTADFQVPRDVWQRLRNGDRVADPHGREPAEKVDPHLFKRPRALAAAGPDARVVLDDGLASADGDPEGAGDPERELKIGGTTYYATPRPPVIERPAYQPMKVEPRPRAPKKRRVEGRYLLTRVEEISDGELADAFETKKALIWPPLREHRRVDGGVEVVVQYEPPNAGGHRGDVDRIAERAAKVLGAEWRAL